MIPEPAALANAPTSFTAIDIGFKISLVKRSMTNICWFAMNALTWPSIYSLFEGPAHLARVIGVSRQFAHQIMRDHRPMPPKHYGALVRWAAANSHYSITAYSLVKLGDETQANRASPPSELAK